MKLNDTTSNAAGAAAADAVAKPIPINQLTPQQKQKVTSELLRINALLNSQPERETHKDVGGDKADRASLIDSKG